MEEAAKELTWADIEADNDDPIPPEEILLWFETALRDTPSDFQKIQGPGEYYKRLAQIDEHSLI
jgi:hypothetical protein